MQTWKPTDVGSTGTGSFFPCYSSWITYEGILPNIQNRNGDLLIRSNVLYLLLKKKEHRWLNISSKVTFYISQWLTQYITFFHYKILLLGSHSVINVRPLFMLKTVRNALLWETNWKSHFFTGDQRSAQLCDRNCDKFPVPDFLTLEEWRGGDLKISLYIVWEKCIP